jgi:hypothetical protein
MALGFFKIREPQNLLTNLHLNCIALVVNLYTETQPHGFQNRFITGSLELVCLLLSKFSNLFSLLFDYAVSIETI